MTPFAWFLVALALGVIAAAVFFFWRMSSRTSTRPAADHHLLALEALADGESERAIAELQKAIQEGQGGLDAFIRLGDLYRAEGQLRKAIHLHRSLQIRQGWPEADRLRIHRSLADDFLAAGRWEEALIQLEAWRKIAPQDAGVHRRTSQAHLHRGETDKAMAALRRAHKLEGEERADERAILLAESARRMIKDQQWKEARRAIQEAVKQDELCIPALRLCAELNMQEGREEEAADMVQRVAMSALPGSELEYARMEKLFFDLGRFHEVQFVYQEVLSKDPQFWPARFALAGILDKRGSREEAVGLLDPAIAASDAVASRAAARLLDWEEPRKAAEWLERWKGAHESYSRTYRCRNCGTEHSGPRWYCPTCHGFKSYEPIDSESASTLRV